MAKNTNFGNKLPGFKIQFSHLLALGKLFNLSMLIFFFLRYVVPRFHFSLKWGLLRTQFCLLTIHLNINSQ